MQKIISKVLFISFLISSVAVAQGVCPEGTSALQTIKGKETCKLSGRYMNDLTLTADINWYMEGGVFIGSNDNFSDLVQEKVTLNIEAGTFIYGATGSDFLVIDRGGMINAKGTADAPIVMTTIKTLIGQPRVRGSWGGLIINGNAPINGCETGVCESQGEGATGLYGGSNVSDNSGVLNYVVVEFAGFAITPDNELNGIAFQGVGNGTLVDYVQVHMNADDGVEFFGGTVDVKHLVLTGIRDDSLDWTSGWKGRAQFVVIEQYSDQAENGIEADNKKSPADATPRSAPYLANMSLFGTDGSSALGGNGILLRRGTGAYISNSYITGFKKACINIDDNETFRNAIDGNIENGNNPGITMTNVVVNCSESASSLDSGKNEPWEIDSWFFNQPGNTADPIAFNGYSPVGNALTINDSVSIDNVFFEDVDFIGAVKDASDDWYKSWTTDAKQ